MSREEESVEATATETMTTELLPIGERRVRWAEAKENLEATLAACALELRRGVVDDPDTSATGVPSIVGDYDEAVAKVACATAAAIDGMRWNEPEEPVTHSVADLILDALRDARGGPSSLERPSRERMEEVLGRVERLARAAHDELTPEAAARRERRRQKAEDLRRQASALEAARKKLGESRPAAQSSGLEESRIFPATHEAIDALRRAASELEGRDAGEDWEEDEG